MLNELELVSAHEPKYWPFNGVISFELVLKSKTKIDGGTEVFAYLFFYFDWSKELAVR